MADDLHLIEPPAAEAVAARPLFGRYLFERQTSYTAAGRALDLSKEGVRQMCLAFGHPLRLKPSKTVAARIEAWSGGAVPAWTFVDTPEARAAFFGGPLTPPSDDRGDA